VKVHNTYETCRWCHRPATGTTSAGPDARLDAVLIHDCDATACWNRSHAEVSGYPYWRTALYPRRPARRHVQTVQGPTLLDFLPQKEGTQ
jgi:hypothetical protein